MTLLILGHDFSYEMECLVRLFYPGERIAITKEGPETPDAICTEMRLDAGGLLLRVRVCLGEYDREQSERGADLPQAERERRLSVLLFELLCEQTGTRPRWGILTGVRPVRFCHHLLDAGKTPAEGIKWLENTRLVERPKAQLAMETAQVQRPMLRAGDKRDFSLYIGIPFCPSRCLYCSFVSESVARAGKLVPRYVELLCEELREIAKIVREHSLVLRTVYWGGGTPTSLEPEQLTAILHTLQSEFELGQLDEYTVEAGRPDSITEEKLERLRQYSVGRISINPQTLNDNVLREIGRTHTVEQFFGSFALARRAGFPVINTDLIAGLPGESKQSFLEGMRGILGLRPENITLHTLTVKRSATLRRRADAFEAAGGLSYWLDEAAALLRAAGYRPYYLYRQKGARENLENVGYSLPGAESDYNVAMMEEVQTVLGAGAGAVSKLYAGPGQIGRVFNFKYPFEYNERFGEIIDRKSALRRFYEAI
jgi:coproporphyrinogen dehydrogenase HemZ